MSSKGGCYCGKVRFEITNEIRFALNCHCRNIRQAHGAPYYPAGYIHQRDFRITSGMENLQSYQVAGSYDRNFCGACGGRLFNRFEIGDVPLMNFALSTLDEAPGADLIKGHANVESKAPWHVINDGLPQYPKWPPGFPESLIVLVDGDS